MGKVQWTSADKVEVVKSWTATTHKIHAGECPICGAIHHYRDHPCDHIRGWIHLAASYVVAWEEPNAADKERDKDQKGYA